MTGEPKPCGGYHVLPCGLDVSCSVPIRYFDDEKTNQEIWCDYNG